MEWQILSVRGFWHLDPRLRGDDGKRSAGVPGKEARDGGIEARDRGIEVRDRGIEARGGGEGNIGMTDKEAQGGGKPVVGSAWERLFVCVSKGSEWLVFHFTYGFRPKESHATFSSKPQ